MSSVAAVKTVTSAAGPGVRGYGVSLGGVGDPMADYA